MTRTSYIKATTILFAALLGVMLVVPGASAEEAVGTNSFPGSTGAMAFTSDRDGINNLQVYRMNGDGYGQTRLTETPGMNQDPTWSSDGKKIAFTNFDANRDIYQMNADGSDERNLTNAAGDDIFPAYSATATRIVFTSSRDNNQSDLYLMTLNASGQTTGLDRLTTSATHEYLPSVSPDGRRVAFVSDRGGNPEVYRMAVAPEGKANKPVNLSKNPARDLVPTWSPDGKKVAFQSNRTAPDNSTDYEIWRVRATDGANPTSITNNSSNEYQPDWQPLT